MSWIRALIAHDFFSLKNNAGMFPEQLAARVVQVPLSHLAGIVRAGAADKRLTGYNK